MKGWSIIFWIQQQDMTILMNIDADSLVQYAYTDSLSQFTLIKISQHAWSDPGNLQ